MQRGTALMASIAGAALLLLAVAASAEPSSIWRDIDLSSGTGDTLPPATLPPAGRAGEPDVPDLRWLLLGLVLLAGIALFVAFVWGLSRVRWRLPARRDTPGFATLPEVAPEELLIAADEFDVLIARGTARNAIVACWVRLEQAVEEAGLVRDPSETAAEMTGRVLRSYAVDGATIGALASLYREARFSTHEMGERHRDEAQRELAAIRGQLRESAATDTTRSGT